MKTGTNSTGHGNEETTMSGYFKGDKMEYTGKTETLHGSICYEAILVEGHRKGETIWTYRAPGTTGAYTG